MSGVQPARLYQRRGRGRLLRSSLPDPTETSSGFREIGLNTATCRKIAGNAFSQSSFASCVPRVTAQRHPMLQKRQCGEKQCTDSLAASVRSVVPI
jgi:hypothetical protein